VRARGPAPWLSLDPNVLLAFGALLSLQLVTWFGSLAALAFLVSGFLLWARQPALAFEDLRRFWWVFLLPAWCLLSTFWSAAPDESLRLGVQLAITVAVAVAMGSRMPPRALVLAALAAFAAAGLMCLAFGNVRGDGGGWLGIYGSKNAYAFAMSGLTLVGLAAALAPEGRMVRLLGLAAALLGAFLLVQGQSAGALVSTMVAAGAGASLLPMRRMSPSLRLLTVALAVLGAVAVGLVAWGFRDALASAFLEATGKEVTLTGRTDLWAEAFAAIAERPLLGHGFLAFWVPGNPVAEAMWAMFGIAGKTGFNFHNTWINNAVEIGLVGVGIQLAVFGATLAVVVRWALARPSLASIFFVMLLCRLALLSMVEVVVYHNFNDNTVLSLAALVAGLRVAGARASSAAGSRAGRLTTPVTARRGAAGPTGSATAGEAG
jgi:exopolysaccharide production protein ExoQ